VNSADLARRLQDDLGLTHQPVALAFVDAAPEGMAVPPGPAPSACSFWSAAEQGTFYAAAGEHFNCPVGSMVMGFELPEEVQQQLGELVGTMCAKDYLSADEPPKIPVVKTAHAGIVYGPLGEATDPDVVLLWVTPRQAMLCNEAMGTAAWTTGVPATTGRPGCAALPLAMAEGSPSISLGCSGMRTFTEIGDGLMLIAVPGSRLGDFADALRQTVGINGQMDEFYAASKQRVAGG
jgi:uncharacterized protein (DUF169 family)